VKRRRGKLVAFGLVVIGAHGAFGQSLPVPEPEGYEIEHYRGPTPATLSGARVLTTGQAQTIWRSRAGVFVDVLPRPPKPSNLPPGTLWHEAARPNIPGSIWLPDTGYGALAAPTEGYLRASLEQATGGDRKRLLVFYCLKSCWHSWNAAKRALAIGYPNVAWYPDGTDGWSQAGLPLEAAEPAPGRQQ
jgi:PQQ-dependent catabolism-associated CXXCW motif protein